MRIGLTLSRSKIDNLKFRILSNSSQPTVALNHWRVIQASKFKNLDEKLLCEFSLDEEEIMRIRFEQDIKSLNCIFNKLKV